MRNVEKAPHVFLLLLFLVAVFVFPPGSVGANSFYLAVTFLVVAVLASTKSKGIHGSMEYLRLSVKKEEIPSLIIWGIGLAIIAFVLTSVLSMIFVWLGINDANLVTTKVLSFPASILIMAFTLTPIGEEMLFRGYLFRKITDIVTALKWKTPSWVFGALFSSAIFAAIHVFYGSISEMIVAFFVGFLFCIFTQKKDSLVPAIVAHSLYNLFSIASIIFLGY